MTPPPQKIRDESRTNGDTGKRVTSVYARFGVLFVYQLVDQLRQDLVATGCTS
jgi:hypothetical protein